MNNSRGRKHVVTQEALERTRRSPLAVNLEPETAPTGPWQKCFPTEKHDKACKKHDNRESHVYQRVIDPRSGG